MAEGSPTDEQRAHCLRLLAHDLNNPLTAIRILAEMLRDETGDAETRRDMVDVVEAADLATVMVDGLSSLLRLEGDDDDYTWFPIDLGEVIRTAVDRPALRRHIEVNLPREIQLGGDRRALGRAFTDLLVNARRLVEGRQVVVVSMRDGREGTEIVVYHPGLGVPKALRDKLFQTYGAVELRREHRIPVAAVGLAYVEYVMRKHGGSVRCEDAPGGMYVVVALPQ